MGERVYWLVWGVDDRPLEYKRVKGKRRPGRLYNGVWHEVDPAKRMPFSYVAWTQRAFGCNSPWAYARNEAERFYSRKAAYAMRRFLWEHGWGRKNAKTLREAYGITKVTVKLKCGHTCSQHKGSTE